MPSSFAQKRAVMAVVGFSLVGIVGAWMTAADWPSALGPALFFVMIIVNTYYSIRCFSDVPGSQTAMQFFVDTLLVLTYIWLALCFGDPEQYLLVTIILFLIAAIKYALLLADNHFTARLRRKIILDCLCGVACTLALAGVMTGNAAVSLAVWLFAFLCGNIYVLMFSDLYRPIVRQR